MSIAQTRWLNASTDASSLPNTIPRSSSWAQSVRENDETLLVGISPPSAVRLLTEIDGWVIERGHHLTRRFTFPDFAQALAFVNRIGEVAEAAGATCGSFERIRARVRAAAAAAACPAGGH